MKVRSVNTGQPTIIEWRGKNVSTGIYKMPTPSAIYLGITDVESDSVVDRKHHGGIDKACYLYSTDHYPYWKQLYPDLPWNWGMFGENVSVDGLKESDLNIGDIIRVGKAEIQISEPRQPCYKLGVRFGNQRVIKDFINFGHSGTYVRVLTPGYVEPGDTLKIIQKDSDRINLQTVFQQLYHGNDKSFIEKALNHPYLAESCKRGLKRKLE